jgi:hypothetical protein
MKDSIMVDVRLDPRLNISGTDLAARTEMTNAFYTTVTRAQKAFQALQDMRKDIKMVESMMTNAPDSIQTKIKDRQKDLVKAIETLELKVMEPADVKGYTNEININEYIYDTQAYLNTSLGTPGSNARDQLRLTQIEVDKFTQEVNAFLQKEWTEYQAFVRQHSWPLFKNLETVK